MSSAKPIKPLLVAPSSTARLMPSTPVDSNPVSIRKTLNASNIVNNRNQMTMVEKPKRKRQRLDHLSQEEKIMRRKLKNRMAAQSARDRKKVKMLDLESVNNGLKAQNEILIKKNACLSQRIKALEKENELLRKNISTNIPSECTITPKKEDLLDMIKLEDVDGEGIIFDVNMSDASYFSELIAGSSCKSPMSSASSDVSDDSGCLLSHGDAASSSSPDCSTMDESFESAELISEPQQKDQDLPTVLPRQERLSAHQCLHQSMESKSRSPAKTRSTTSSLSNDLPLNLTKASSRSQKTKQFSTEKTNPSVQSTPRLMNFLFLLATLLISPESRPKSLKNIESILTTSKFPNLQNSLLHSKNYPQWNCVVDLLKEFKRVRFRPKHLAPSKM